MQILVINGSPRPHVSNTMKLTTAFLEGMGDHNVETINIAEEHIEPCHGCFCCWEKTPGSCVIQDSMKNLLQKYREAELVIWSFPLYYFDIPSKTKAFIDRCLPLLLPYINEQADGKPIHPYRCDLSAQKHVLISTCGFYTIEKNFDALIKHFDLMFSDRYTKILCPQGELFRVPELKPRTDQYRNLVKQAGAEYISTGSFSAETEKQLAEPMFPKKAFMEMANASWNVSSNESDSAETRLLVTPREQLLRQMAAIYTPGPSAPNEVKHIEFFFTDCGEKYQLRVSKEGAQFIKSAKDFAPYSVRIETPFDVWQDISNNKISGTDALFQQKYHVLGDFSLTTTVMDGFSVKKAQTPSQNAPLPKKRSMMVMLMPFLALWVLLPVFGNIGALAAILISACVPLTAKLFRLSPYDTASAFLTSVLSVAFLIGVSPAIIVTLSYAIFGTLWLASVFFRIPLCAWYSANAYNGDAAFDNKLFIHTNRIIAAMWGVLYLFTSIWTWFIMNSVYASITGLINSVVPALAGVFTAVFVKWYPAHYAQKQM